MSWPLTTLPSFIFALLHPGSLCSRYENCETCQILSCIRHLRMGFLLPRSPQNHLLSYIFPSGIVILILPSSNCLLILRSWLRTYHCHDEASYLFSVPSEQFAFCNFSFICVLACLSAYPLRTMIMSVSFPSAPLEPCTQRRFNRCL